MLGSRITWQHMRVSCWPELIFNALAWRDERESLETEPQGGHWRHKSVIWEFRATAQDDLTTGHELRDLLLHHARRQA
jgi:hypothetical protein